MLLLTFEYNCVTPYVGVWIETAITVTRTGNAPVTPYVGVWIETLLDLYLKE